VNFDAEDRLPMQDAVTYTRHHYGACGRFDSTSVPWFSSAAAVGFPRPPHRGGGNALTSARSLFEREQNGELVEVS